jgi:hypothetical protein
MAETVEHVPASPRLNRFYLYWNPFLGAFLSPVQMVYIVQYIRFFVCVLIVISVYSKGFCRFCITPRITGFLVFIHRLLLRDPPE